MIDCLGRSNYLDYAESVYDDYNKSCLIMLISLISSSRIQNDIKQGKRIFEKINDIVNKFKNENHDIILFTFVSILLFTLSIRLFHQLRKIKKG